MNEQDILCLYSKQTSVTILDRVNKDFARIIVEEKEKVENMYNTCQITERGSRPSSNTGASGYGLFSDNVGKVINPRYLKHMILNINKDLNLI